MKILNLILGALFALIAAKVLFVGIKPDLDIDLTTSVSAGVFWLSGLIGLTGLLTLISISFFKGIKPLDNKKISDCWIGFSLALVAGVLYFTYFLFK